MSYRHYRLNLKEIIANSIVYMMIAAAVAYLFYDSKIAFYVLCAGIPVYLAMCSKRLGDRRKKLLRDEFVEMISALETALKAGLSVENAFYEAKKDMDRLYGEDSLISTELAEIMEKVKIGVDIREGIDGFASACGIDEINDFSVVFCEAIVNGGSLGDIITDTVRIIRDTVRTENEIDAILKGKMLEQNVMSVIPFFIMGYLRLTSSDFVEVLYHNITGVIIMSICLAIYTAAFIMARKIADIKV